ncbi:SGNH/GDSL hydrolase family protein [Edaphobacter dinghuensis]|uniref:SGNH hydrolase n=1 Tax=Edaphobacter dinghuensis TaxID=1560005 RepID=A0A917M0P4_9BACT|nr:SGNH/GDSL hydrolase family protein [Edaphobacter dinghuensis]GGG70301.1 SGNH hydrolase [Edaphobacter dinghuensis]
MNLKRRTLLPLALLLFCLCCFSTNSASAASPDHWVGTWATAPMAQDNHEVRVAADTTYREIVHVSIGGPAVRVILTNEFGVGPLTIGAGNVALSAGGSDINTAASAPLTFNGRPSIVIPAGALVVSDPVNLKLAPTSDLAVSVFIPAQPIQQVSAHGFADQTNYTAAGNVVSAKSLDAPQKIYSWPFLKGVDVRADSKAAAIVAFGDSITDGAHSTRDANARWPDVLAARLQSNKDTVDLGVLNEGIGGNRILHDDTGPSALARFDRDVLAQAGVKYLIILESINDIGHAQDPRRPYDVVTADDLIAGLSQLATRAHTHGIKVFGATLTPYVGAGYSSPAGEAIREAVNQWIRTTNQLDGVIDFDKATSDPAHPNVFLPADDSGDHLHPNDTGYKAMGNSIDLKIFKDK